MPIFKATIMVTVLLDEPDVDLAKKALGKLTLVTLAEEMDDGQIVGDHLLMSVDLVPPDRVGAELKAAGNDGTFFEYSE